MKRGGIVLCGGRSSRMGQAKCWLPFGSETLLERSVRILQQAVDLVIVVAASGQDLPSLPHNVETVRDEMEGRGPLQGMAAGFAALGDRVDTAFVASCDAPLLTSSFVIRVLDLLGTFDAAVPVVDGREHPLAAAYRINALPAIENLLAGGQLQVRRLLERIRTRWLEAGELSDIDPGLRSLRNVNTPEDYAAALRDFTSQ